MAGAAIHGKPVDHTLNGQVLSPELDDYRNIPCRIIASGAKRAILVAWRGPGWRRSS
nr:hypothetical protein [Mesorhizobium sp.]